MPPAVLVEKSFIADRQARLLASAWQIAGRAGCAGAAATRGLLSQERPIQIIFANPSRSVAPGAVPHSHRPPEKETTEKAARKSVEIANTIEPVQDGRIHIEKINAPFLCRDRGTLAEYSAGLELAIERGRAALT